MSNSGKPSSDITYLDRKKIDIRHRLVQLLFIIFIYLQYLAVFFLKESDNLADINEIL